MQVALLSDIHSNLNAFSTVLSSLPKTVDEIWITGDLVGYYYDTNETIDLIKKNKCRVTQGNHDRYLIEFMHDKASLAKYTAKYGTSLQRTLENISKENFDFIKSLKPTETITTSRHSFLMCHGSPWDQDKHIYPDVDDTELEKYLAFSQDVFIQGHTHYPMNKDYKTKKIINPGSVGQSRNGTKSAHWALLDTDKLTLDFKTTAYDKTNLIQQISKNDPEVKYLKSILVENE